MIEHSKLEKYTIRGENIETLQSYRRRNVQIYYLLIIFKKGEIQLKTIGEEFIQAKLENPNMHHDMVP